MDSTFSPFKSVVFAGGGCRCVWQVGFWETAAPALGIAPEAVAATSAGAVMACILFAGRADYGLRYMKKAMHVNKRNVYPLNVFTSRSVFPHERIFRRAVLAAIDAGALERLKKGPDILVTLSRPPRWTGPRSAVFIGFLCYLVEKRVSRPVHPVWARKAGFRPEIVSVRDCRTPDELAELLLGSSCTPPAVPVMRRGGRAVLDGGLVDNVPAYALRGRSGPTLVLVTRSYPPDRLPIPTDRVYAQPSRPITIYKWDYTDPKGLQEAFDLGRRDGERFAKDYRPGAGESGRRM